MKTIIIGASFTGVQLARALIADHHRVVLIDNDADRVRDVGNQLDCTVVQSAGNSLDVLEREGLATADALIAVTESDEVNMISCALADAVYPKVLKIARVRNYAYYAVTEDTARKYADKFTDGRRPPFGIDWMVNPDVEAARAITRVLSYGAVGGILELGQGAGIVTLTLGEGSPLVGMPLWRLSSVEGWHYLIAYVETETGVSLAGGETVLHAGDRLGVLTKLEDVSKVALLCAAPKKNVSRLVLVGAGRIGALIVAGQREQANALSSSLTPGTAWNPGTKVEIAVVDEGTERCQAIADQFRDVHVFCGDATDLDLVREEGLGQYDMAVAASENYERNLITAAYLKSCGVARSIALTANADVAGMAVKLGVDVAIPMHDSVVDSIISHLRGSNVKSVHTVCRGAFEIVTCLVSPESKAAGRKLSDLKMTETGLVLMVQTSTTAGQVARGDTIVEAGATMVLLVPAGDLRAVRLFTC